MKNKNILSLFCILSMLLYSQNILAKQKIINQPGSGLTISSVLTLNEKYISGYTLVIYNETQACDTIVVTNAKPISFKLSYNHNYTLQYLKDGFYERLVLIDTKITKAEERKAKQFDFEIEMIQNNQPCNTLDNLPLSMVYYDESTNEFEYNRDYYRQVRGKEIKETDENEE